MTRRSWMVGLAGLGLGLALGSVSTYLLVRSGFAPGFGPRNPESVPEPSEQKAQAAFHSLLSQAGVEADVTRFQRTDWSRNTVRLGPVDTGKGTVELKPLAIPYNTYWVAYEAEIAFRRRSQVKENETLMWSADSSVRGDGWSMSRSEARTFEPEERRRVRGLLRFWLRGTEWELEPECKIDAAR